MSWNSAASNYGIFADVICGFGNQVSFFDWRSHYSLTDSFLKPKSCLNGAKINRSPSLSPQLIVLTEQGPARYHRL